jgi:ring-1,2-phenylacetyl-CoA epoxidase subunit PaaC
MRREGHPTTSTADGGRDIDRDPAREALAGLLFQLADDDLVLAHRASEWLGLHPHLEEDVAYASIAQDELGHAAAYYGLLEDLGYGPADDLAVLRDASARVNSVLLEWPNGPGDYVSDPHFDWAFQLLRHYAYDSLERLRLERLAASGYRPLALLAAKVLREERYHEWHHTVWLERLAAQGEVVRERLNRAGRLVAELAADLADLGPWGEAWVAFGWLPDARGLDAAWRQHVNAGLVAVGLQPWPERLPALNGRRGQHSPHLGPLLATLSEVRRLDPAARW